MPRKKSQQNTSASNQQSSGDVHATVATAEQKTSDPSRVNGPAWIDGPPNPMHDYDGPRVETPKNWGDPYKSIFNCSEMGFTLGEDRRFKQRVFTFAEKPADQIITQLKDNGFTYRAAEKSWTITANAETRKMSDEFARQWAGPSYVQGIER